VADRFYLGDTHVHSTRSDGRLSPAELALVAEARGLDFLAVTDHAASHRHRPPAVPDRGAAGGRRPVMGGLTLLPGQEVSAGGRVHFVLLGCARPTGRVCLEDLGGLGEEVHRSGGLVVLAHPWTAFARSAETIRLLDLAFASGHLDGLELFSGALLPADLGLWRRMLAHYLREWAAWGPAVLASSDWHRRAHGRTVGCACTAICAASPAPGDLLAALAARRAVAVWRTVAALEDGLRLDPGEAPEGRPWPRGFSWERHLCGPPDLVAALLAQVDEVDRRLAAAGAPLAAGTADSGGELRRAARSAHAAGNDRRATALLNAADLVGGVDGWR
jgi:hypothetical protein